MIKITIEKITIEKFTEIKSFTLTEKPTTITKPSEYGSSREERLYDRTFETKEVPMQREVTRTILKQEIQNDDEFDLKMVIAAINGMQ
jgi:hypothetical protein